MADKLLLIDEEGKTLGTVSRDQALYLAFEKGYDLVLLNEKITPPVAKLMDYGKYLYNQTKQISKQKAHSKIGEVKEIRLSIKISEHDLETKTIRARKFLDDGHKVKISIQLRGREMMFKDKVNIMFQKIKNQTGGEFEASPERMGNRFFVTIVKKTPKKTNETENS